MIQRYRCMNGQTVQRFPLKTGSPRENWVTTLTRKAIPLNLACGTIVKSCPIMILMSRLLRHADVR